jgi:hypothetical protein
MIENIIHSFVHLLHAKTLLESKMFLHYGFRYNKLEHLDTVTYVEMLITFE